MVVSKLPGQRGHIHLSKTASAFNPIIPSKSKAPPRSKTCNAPSALNPIGIARSPTTAATKVKSPRKTRTNHTEGAATQNKLKTLGVRRACKLCVMAILFHFL